MQEAESEVSAGELKEYLRERLPEYMQVQWVVALEELPLTANGKVDRRALQALEVEVERGQSVQPRTPAEEILAAIWAEVLGRETVSVHDNFFELGGHSLLATQVMSRVREAFGVEVALRKRTLTPAEAERILHQVQEGVERPKPSVTWMARRVPSEARRSEGCSCSVNSAEKPRGRKAVHSSSMWETWPNRYGA